MRRLLGDRLPYVVLVPELEEQPSLITIGNLLDGSAEDPKSGTPVEVTFERVDDDVTLPQWRLAGAGR